jgi:hypothetical protein
MRSVVDSAYSFFAFSINTINVSSNVTAYGSRSANVHKRPTVERSEINPDGGHTYLVTFQNQWAMCEMEVLMSNPPVSIMTLHQGNELKGSFRTADVFCCKCKVASRIKGMRDNDRRLKKLGVHF